MQEQEFAAHIDYDSNGYVVLHPTNELWQTQDKLIICNSCPLSTVNAGVCDFRNNGEKNPQFNLGPDGNSSIQETLNFIAAKALCIKPLKEQTAIVKETRSRVADINFRFSIY